MAIAHLRVTAQSRGKGASVIAKAAYNSGQKLRDLSGALQDYTHKGGVKFRALVYNPAVKERESRQEFWASVEKSEKRKDACLSREFCASLPVELSYDQNLKLTADWSKYLIQRYDLRALDVAVHYPRTWRPWSKSKTENPHIHALAPDRDRHGKKLNLSRNRNEVLELRQAWEKICNQHLAAAGVQKQISMKSNKKQIEEFADEIEKLKAEEERIKREIARLEKLETAEREKKPMPAAQRQQHGQDIRAQYMGIVGRDGGARIRRRMEGISFEDYPEPTRQLIAIIKRNADAGADNAANFDILAQHLAQLHTAQDVDPRTMPTPTKADGIIYQRHAAQAGRVVGADKIADAIALRLRVCGHTIGDAVRIMRAGMSDNAAYMAVANVYHTDRGDNAAQNMGKYADQWRREERGIETTRRTGGAAQAQTPQAAPTPQSGPRM